MIMNYEEKKKEAILRMNLLKLHTNVINEFVDENKLNKSYQTGLLYWLSEEEKKIVKDYEEENNVLVYHVVETHTTEYTFFDLFFVSNYEDEWKMDREDIMANMPFVYSCNRTYNDFSELGSIGIVSSIGGVVRIS